MLHPSPFTQVSRGHHRCHDRGVRARWSRGWRLAGCLFHSLPPSLAECNPQPGHDQPCWLARTPNGKSWHGCGEHRCRGPSLADLHPPFRLSVIHPHLLPRMLFQAPALSLSLNHPFSPLLILPATPPLPRQRFFFSTFDLCPQPLPSMQNLHHTR